MNKNLKRILLLIGVISFFGVPAYYLVVNYLPRFLPTSIFPSARSIYYESDPEKDLIRDNELIAKNPKDARAYYMRGSAYGFLCRHEEADKDYRKATEYGQGDIRLMNAIAYRYYYLLMMPERSLQVSDAAIGIEPDSVDAYVNKGRALVYLGRYDEAFAALDKAVDLSSWCAEAYRLKMMTYGDLRRYDDALQMAEKLTEVKPGDLDSYRKKVYFLVAANKPGAALEVIDYVLTDKNLHDNSRITKCYQAFALLNRGNQGDKAEATDILHRIIEGGQEDDAAMYAYGMLGDKEEFIKRLPRTNPDSRIWVRSNMMFEGFWDDPDFLDAVAI